jgi:arylsulfatase
MVLLALLGVACSPPPGDVLLITCDTLRPDHLGLYGYARESSPTLDAFFADGAVHERAYSTEANTPPAVVSVLSGQYPQDHGVRGFYQLLPPDTALLPQLLPDRYQSAGFVANIVLTDEAMGIAERFDHYDDYVDEHDPALQVYERNASRTTDAAIEWLRTSRDPERPLFLWVHYIDPHGPYSADDPPRRFQHSGRRPVDRSRIRPFQLLPGVDDALDYVDRYDEEIATMDAQVGRLLSAYGDERALDDALVIFTADHGESMFEHRIWFTHGYQVWEEIIRVPLLLRGPGIRSGRFSTPVSGIDVAPTILRHVGAGIPASLPGRPLQDAADADRTLHAEAYQSERIWRSAIRGSDKWTFLVRKGRPGVVVHYDLERDPGELAARPAAGTTRPPRELMQRLQRDPDRNATAENADAGEKLSGPKIDPRVSDEQRERLRALGYVEEPDPATGESP